MKCAARREVARSARAGLLALLLALAAPAAAWAQFEVRAEERARELAAVEVVDVPLRRHLVVDQRLVLWLPEGFVPMPRETAGVASFGDVENGLLVQVTYPRSEPGASLIQNAEEVFDELLGEGAGVPEGPRATATGVSVRRFRLASRPAIEAAGSVAADEGGEEALRIVVTAARDDAHFRTLHVRRVKPGSPPIDALLRQLLRDWSPLDGTAWSNTFERLRRPLLPAEASLALASRNRLLAEVAQPEAIGQPWIGERLRALGTADPALLVDGLLHFHPRVRIACAQALDPLALPESARAPLLALALLDADPAVRYHAARRANPGSANPGGELATETLAHLLDADDDAARGAALQLLAVLPPPVRGEVLLATYSGRLEQLSSATGSFLATLLARWGPPEADAALLAVWKRHRDEELRGAALAALLARGHPDALAAAKERLRRPRGEGPPIDPRVAAEALATRLRADEQEELREMLAALAAKPAETDGEGDGEADGSEEAAMAAAMSGKADGRMRKGDAAKAAPAVGASRAEGVSQAELEEGIAAGRELLAELAEHLAELAAPADPAVECPALAARIGSTWAARRRSALGCPAPPPPVALASLALPRPGGYAAALLDLLARLQVGSTVDNLTFHGGIGILLEGLDDWAGDPVSMSSTGLDLSAPLRLGWGPGEGSIEDSDGSGWSLEVRAADGERLLDSLLRVATRKGGLTGVSGGLLVTQALPLLPAALFAAWDDERAAVTGEGADTSTREPPVRHVALAVDGTAGEAPDALYDLTIDDRGGAEWTVSRLSWRDDRLLLVTGELATQDPAPQGPAPQDPAPQDPAPDVAPEDPAPREGAERVGEAGDRSGRLEVDLSALLRRFALESDDPEDADEVPAGVRLALSSEVGTAVASRLELTGLTGDWLRLPVDGPAAGLAAPVGLLPADTVAWASLRFDPTALRALLAAESARVGEAIGERVAKELLAATGFLRGEAGLALVGVPSPGEGKSSGEAWERRTIAYFAVEPEAADRFLRRSSRRRSRRGELRVYHWQEGVAVRHGGFLVIAEEPEVLARLGRAPFLAGTAAFAEVVAASPVAAAIHAGFDTDLLADAVRTSLERRSDEGGSLLGVEALRALGRVRGWLRREGGTLVGEVAIAPRLQSAAVQERVRELSDYAGFTGSSIAVDGLGPPGAVAAPYAEIELTLRLPEGASDPGLSWANERLRQERAAPRAYRLVSRPGVPLPERSALSLPIGGAELVPYLRNEHNLALHVEAVRELAESIRGEESDPARMVRAIVDWAHESLEYSVIRQSTSVEEILSTRKADCTEFTQLTIALARSLGIPARPVSGVHVGQEVAILHQWAEVHLDRWYEVDPTFGVVELPAANLRLPGLDGAFLAALPGSRFTVGALASADGGWTRRLALAEGTPRTAAAHLAVEGERVLLELMAAGEGSAPSALLSSDGGRSFAALAAVPPPGELLALFGGHGRLLRAHRVSGETGAAALALHELTPAGEWRALAAPGGLPSDLPAASFGVDGGGFLLLAFPPASEGSSPRLFRLDAELARAEEVPLPAAGEGTWVLAGAGALLAHSAASTGVTVHRWRDGGWQPPLLLERTSGLLAREVRARGEEVELVLEVGVDPGGRDAEGEEVVARGERIVLRVGADGEQTRRSVQAVQGTVSASTTTAAGDSWTFWSDDRAHLLSRRP